MQRKYFKEVKAIRSSFYCGICNWRNHSAISPETMTLHLNHKFCKKFLGKYGQFFKDKYTTLIPYALILDEFIYLISNYKLIKYNADRGILHKYKIFSKKCPGCEDACKEFNLNKFSYLWDGEAQFIKSFLARY